MKHNAVFPHGIFQVSVIDVANGSNVHVWFGASVDLASQDSQASTS